MTVGNVYAVELKEGLFGACRLIKAAGGHTFLYFDGFWDTLPSFRQVWARRDLVTGEECEKGWFKQAIPASFTLLGKRSRSTDGRHGRPEGTSVYQNPAHFLEWFLIAWRRRHDRDALLAETARDQAKAGKVAAEKERKRKAGLTLQKLAREKPFGHWAQMWPRRVVTKVRRLFEDAVRELIRLEKRRDRKSMEAVLKDLVQGLNQLEKAEECIETTEREELVRRIEEMGSLVGLSNKDERLTGERDW